MGIERLSRGQGSYKLLPDTHRDLHVAHCEHHYIFCLRSKTAPAIVVAILHERMDLTARLRDRLG
ncbi:plasmid stabilization protein [Asticcacaulis biprosthecium C19]|uniref:Plasmid stabilization protein n=2 Tax=Asticcacaulis biprosthecium TaxID=76891 RepID=F4QH90_9CAUL|nr:plasmid stabilization protein [Asticcacaulis biprosthecium C19]